MTIKAEFCRDVITRAQLREITGYQGEFMFKQREDNVLIFGFVRYCIISTEIEEEVVIIGVTDRNFETVMHEMKLEAPSTYYALMRELNNVGEKAVIMSEQGFYLIFFSDRETNRVVGVISMGVLAREDIINLAKQVEVNIIRS